MLLLLFTPLLTSPAPSKTILNKSIKTPQYNDKMIWDRKGSGKGEM